MTSRSPYILASKDHASSEPFARVLNRITPQGRNDWEMKLIFFKPLDEPHRLTEIGFLGILPTKNESFVLLFSQKGKPGWNTTIDKNGHTYGSFGIDSEGLLTGLSFLVDDSDDKNPALSNRGLTEEKRRELEGKDNPFLAMLSEYTMMGSAVTYSRRHTSQRTHS